MRPKVYLAGPIAGLPWNVVYGWRHRAQLVLGQQIDCLNPLRGKEHLANEEKIELFYEDHPLTCPAGITTRDRYDVQRCDLILMNLLGAHKVSIGSMVEVGWADAYRKPLVLVIEKNSIHHHPMLHHISTYIVPNLNTGFEVTAGFFGMRPRTHLDIPPNPMPHEAAHRENRGFIRNTINSQLDPETRGKLDELARKRS